MVPISSQTEEIGPASDGETIKMPITALKHLAQTIFKTNFFLPASTKDVSRKERSKQVCNRGFFVSTVFCKHSEDLCFHSFLANTGFKSLEMGYLLRMTGFKPLNRCCLVVLI